MQRARRWGGSICAPAMSAFPPRSPIAGRHQLDERRERSMSAIYATVFALAFAHAICLPSISSYLAGFHSQSIMLGYCISAVCLGELCATPIFARWYETAPARDLAIAALATGTIGSVLYAVAVNDVYVLASRFLVGMATGVQGPFLSMAAGLCKEHERYDTLVAVKSMHTAAFVLGTGVAAVATFVHTPAPVSPLNHMEHMMPKYVQEMHLPNSSYSDSLGTLGDMVIPPDAYSKMGTRIWHAAAAKASAMAAYQYGSMNAEPAQASGASRRSNARSAGPRDARRAHARALLGAGSSEEPDAAPSEAARSVGGRLQSHSWVPAGSPAVGHRAFDAASGSAQARRAPGVDGVARASVGGGQALQRLQTLLRHAKGKAEGRARDAGAAQDARHSGSQWTLTKTGFRGDGWRKLVPSSQDIRKMVPSTDEVSIRVHGALSRLNKEAVQVRNDAMQVGSVTQRDLGMAGIHAGSDSHEGQEGLKTDEDMAREIGDKRMYMPQYVTAIVGHGTKAPGYLAAIVCVGTGMFVWREWSHITSYGGTWDDIRAPIVTIPISQLNPRLNKNMMQLKPLVACLAMEVLVQLWLSSVETIAAPITGIYLGFTIDATAVFMMGIGASGVVGMSLIPAVKRMHTTRTLMHYAYTVGLLGLVLCIPWFGQLSAGQYAFGCYFCAMGFYPLSTMAAQVFARGVVKSSGDGRDVAWMLMYWRCSSVPVKLVAPILLAYSLDFETSASVCYLLLVVAAVCALAVFWQQRRQLMSQNPGDSEPHVLPASGTLIVGQATGLAGSSGTKAYGSF